MGRFQDKSYNDGKPAYQFVDDRPNIDMFTTGGWRTFNAINQAFSDGVTDEFRPYGPGVVLGRTYYQPPIFRGRLRADAGFFMLFQVGGGLGRLLCTCAWPQPWLLLRSTRAHMHTHTHARHHQLNPSPTHPFSQACTADGKFAWQPEQRDVPLVGQD